MARRRRLTDDDARSTMTTNCRRRAAPVVAAAAAADAVGSCCLSSSHSRACSSRRRRSSPSRRYATPFSAMHSRRRTAHQPATPHSPGPAAGFSPASRISTRRVAQFAAGDPNESFAHRVPVEPPQLRHGDDHRPILQIETRDGGSSVEDLIAQLADATSPSGSRSNERPQRTQELRGGRRRARSSAATCRPASSGKSAASAPPPSRSPRAAGTFWPMAR